MKLVLQLTVALLSFSSVWAGDCITCDCFTCKSVTPKIDGTLDIVVGHCKAGSISWMCCVGLDGAKNGCAVTSPCIGVGKCNTIPQGSGLTINVPASTKTFTINTHDGQGGGTAGMESVCGGNGRPQGQPGNSCAAEYTTAHCLKTFDVVTDCKYTYTPPRATTLPTTSPTAKPTPGPTVKLTSSPTAKPTPGPTAKPTPGSTAKPTPGPTPKSSSSGDPHFKTWTGEKFDYHGECDLVLVNNPNFNHGQGLRVHIRTTRIKYFSFIEKVAIQIGSDVLEFDNDAENFMINGEKVGENTKHHKTMLGGFVVRRDPKALSIRLADGKETTAARNAGNVAKIDLHTRKNGFPAVIMDAGHTDIFAGSLGLLGEWGTGRKLARDGVTEVEVDPMDAAEFALEWQVRDTEPSLFVESRFPQFPNTCTPPAKMVVDRLGASLAKKEAEEACAHWQEDKDDCIFDVLATRDILVAEEGHIVHIE